MAGAAPSADDLAKKLASAKHVETKSGTGPDPAAVAAMAKVYSDNGGDLGKISKALGGVAFKDGVKVASADDFAKKFLAGLITKD